jgi:hypothetical protein
MQGDLPPLTNGYWLRFSIGFCPTGKAWHRAMTRMKITGSPYPKSDGWRFLAQPNIGVSTAIDHGADRCPNIMFGHTTD